MRILFIFYLVLLILRPQEIVPALSNVPLLQYLMLLCLGIWLFSRDKQLALPPFKLLAMFIIFVPLTVGIAGWWGGMKVALTELLPVAGLFLIASMATRSLPALRRTMWVTLVCACLLVLYCQVQIKTGMGPLTAVRSVKGRPYYVGIFSDPNDLGQLFVVALAFTLYFLQFARSRWSKLVYYAVLGWLFYGVILSDSRGDLLAALAIIGLEGWHRYGKVVVGIGAALVLPSLFALTRLSQLSAGEESANGRIESWYEGFQMFRTHPVFGVGYDNYTDYNLLTAHNSIVLPMAELGLPGLVMWFGIVWYSFRMLWWVGYGPHAWATIATPGVKQSDPELKAEILAGRGLFMTLVGFAISSLFLSQSYKAPLFLLCGMAVARFVTASRMFGNVPEYRLLGDAPRLLGTTLGCLLVLYVIVRINI